MRPDCLHKNVELEDSQAVMRGDLYALPQVLFFFFFIVLFFFFILPVAHQMVQQVCTIYYFWNSVRRKAIEYQMSTQIFHALLISDSVMKHCTLPRWRNGASFGSRFAHVRLSATVQNFNEYSSKSSLHERYVDDDDDDWPFTFATVSNLFSPVCSMRLASIVKIA